MNTKKFIIPENSNTLEVIAELQIKNIVKIIPFMVEINHLTNNLVQVKANLQFSRTAYKLGQESWSSTLFLRDTIHLKANLFLIRE